MEAENIWKLRLFSLCLTLFFVIPILAPLVSADGMAACDVAGMSECDDYDSNDDGTPHQQDWIRGTYDFDLEDTSRITLSLSWAIREFDRSKVGLDDPLIQTALANDGLDVNDGIPADMIRSYFAYDDGSGTVGDRMLGEVQSTIQDLLSSGFGTVNGINTQYDTSYTEGSTTIPCTTDASIDSIYGGEGASQNNVFDPPLCFSTIADISLSTSTFNLLNNSDLDLERAYQGLLIMGSELTTKFDVFAEPGHASTFSINPPDYATIIGVDSNGSVAARPGPPAYFAGEWTVDNLDAGVGDSRIDQTVSLTMAYRNSSTTQVVELDPNDEAISLYLKVDLFNEQAVQIDFIAGLKYLDQNTMTDWGISLVELSELATIPQITSDGIRLAYENGIAPLDDFTDQFPVDSIGDAFSDSIPGNQNIEMGQLTWVSDSVADGIQGAAGGLNYTHSTGCSETVTPPATLSYCIQGPSAMGYNHPIYLRSTSNTFNLGLLDIIQDNIPETQFSTQINSITEEDLRRVMDAGLSLETVLNTDFLESMIPSDLPPTEITLELILPSWIETIDGEDRIILQHSLEGDNRNEISIAGPSPYTYNHPISNAAGDVICVQTQKTCVSTSLDIDFDTFDVNEWTKSVSVEFGLEASAVVHRVALPQGYYDVNDDTTIRMDVIPSDLVRLMGDIMGRTDDPKVIRQCLDPDSSEADCDPDRLIEFNLTSEGLMDLGTDVGVKLTNEIQILSKELTEFEDSPFNEVDIGDFEIKTSLAGLGEPGPIVGDEIPLSVSIKIPKVRYTLAISSPWGDLFSGDLDLLTFSLLTEDSIRSPFLSPMVSMIDSISTMFSNSIVSTDGITFPPEDGEALTFSTGSWDTTMHEETELDLSGPVSFTLPKGIKAIEATSTQGNMVLSTEDGRQVITYTIPPDGLDDEVTIRLQVTWMYLLGQFWAYPAVVFILLILLIRRRRKKKRKKRAARESKNSLLKAQKMGLSESDFAQMAGLVDRQVGGYEEGIDPFEAMQNDEFN
ncbi:MAG: hypothetical protein CBC77_002410 [Euryarchaeota archaeon TMED117]|nr:MAG: hypothetical protein CBC77_002410 [Euryarchaeota archaeon TMED117]